VSPGGRRRGRCGRLRGVLCLLPFLTSAAAFGQDAPTALLVLALDDRAALGLHAPAVDLDLPGVDARPMIDDGSRVGDQPGDGIWMFTAAVPAARSLSLRVRDDGRDVAALDLAIPAGDRAFFAYKLLADGSLVPDPAARPVERVGDTILAQGDDVATAAAVEGASTDRVLGDDEVLVRIALDDRAVQRVHDPTVAVPEQGKGPVHLSDDGSVSGDTPADRIYLAELVVQRTQYLSFVVTDGDEALGELTVFLPSTGQAAVSMRSTEGDPGVELAVEPTATGANEGPATASGGGATAADGDRLAHVVWVGVALFAIAFAWLRTVLWRAWTDELRPVLRKLDAWLDAQQGQGGDGSGGAM